MRELTKLRRQVAVWLQLDTRLSDALELAGLADDELAEELTREAESLSRIVNELEFRTLFSGQYDDENALLAIHAGAGVRRRRTGRKCCSG